MRTEERRTNKYGQRIIHLAEVNLTTGEAKEGEAFEYFCGDCQKYFADRTDIREENVYCGHCDSDYIFYDEEIYRSQHNEEGELFETLN